MSHDINKILKNHFIHDCCILSNDYISVIAEKYLTEDEYSKDELGPIRILTCRLSKSQGWGYFQWKGKNSFYKPRLANTMMSWL